MRPTIFFEGVEYRRYDARYAISRSGRVLRLRTLKSAGVYKLADGYLRVRQTLVHRMVAKCWLEKKPVGAYLVHHINHDKSDNRAENLEWLSAKQHVGEKHREALGRYVRTKATRQKLRKYRTGRKTSEATKRKQRRATLRLGIKPPPRPLGYKCSDEAKANMSLNSPNAQACRIGGVVYRSFSEAGRVLGIKPHTLRKRCLSSSFEDHELL